MEHQKVEKMEASVKIKKRTSLIDSAHRAFQNKHHIMGFPMTEWLTHSVLSRFFYDFRYLQLPQKFSWKNISTIVFPEKIILTFDDLKK